MSQENVEKVRAMFAAFTQGDAQSSLESMHPEIEWDVSRIPVDDVQAVYYGLDGVTSFYRGWLSAWETIEFNEPELIDVGDYVFMWIEGQKARGRTSGIEVEMPPYAFVWTFDGGKAVRMRLYPKRHEALAAVGLTE